MSEIRNFITENNISFEPGSRNTSVVTLIGYAQHLGLTNDQLQEELTNEIELDQFIQEEIDRLWDYCKFRDYKAYWVKPEAALQYVFI